MCGKINYKIIKKNMQTAPVSIIVLCHNAAEVTKTFFSHLYNNTPKELFHVVVVDNASTDSTLDFLTSFLDNKDNSSIVLHSENLGVINGRNFGYNIIPACASSEFVIFIDNDQFVADGWLEQHMAVINHGYGLVGVEAWTLNRSLMPSKRILSLDQSFNYVGCGGMIIRQEVIRSIGLFDESFNPAYFEDPDFCYDKKTKIMTKYGFKYFKDLTYDDLILTMNDDKIFEYQKPVNIIKKFESKLLHFKNQQVDIMCSEDQRLLVGYKRNPWKDIDKGLYKDIDFIKAKDINRKLRPRQCRYFIKKSGGKWIGEDNDRICVEDSEYDTAVFCEFMGWFLSEGYVYPEEIRVKRRGWEIIICQLKDIKKISVINNVIVKMGFTPRRTKIGFSFSNKTLCRYLQKFGKSDTKYIPEEIKMLSRKYLKIFLNAYIAGDGSIKKNSKGFSIATVSSKMKDDLLEILIKLGRSFTHIRLKGGFSKFPNGKHYNCKTSWQIQSYNKTFAYLPKAKVVEYNDYVYDVTVPNSKIYIQRNGKNCWSSNCFRAYENGFLIGWNIKARIHHMPHQTLGKLPGEQKQKYIFDSWKKFRDKWKNHQIPVFTQAKLPEFLSEKKT